MQALRFMLERHAIDEAVFVGDQDRPRAHPREAVGEATEVVVELLVERSNLKLLLSSKRELWPLIELQKLLKVDVGFHSLHL